MSFLAHIAACNAHNLNNFLPFTVAGERVGWVKHGFAGRLEAYPDAFAVSDDGVTLASGLDDYNARTRAVDAPLRDLADQVLSLTGSRSEVSHRPLPSDDPVRRRPDIGYATAQTGWEPTTSLREGLERTIAYFEELLRSETPTS